MAQRDLHDVLIAGIEKAWQEDEESQKKFLDVIFRARGMKPFDARKYHMLFIPNDGYLIEYCGIKIMEPELGCYSYEDGCIWNNFLIMPIFNVNGIIVGLCGFNPFNYVKAHEENDWSCIYYQYSTKKVFQKGNFLFSPNGAYEKALDDGYLIVVDGTFDAISLVENGFNAVALMDSTITDERVTLLRFIKDVIVIPDNDDAGLKAFSLLERKVKGVRKFSQKYDKDIDGALKSDFSEAVLTELRECITKKNLLGF